MQTTGRELANVAPDEWGMIQQQSQALVSSGFLPRAIDSWQKAAAIILLGREIGVPPWTAINGINVIQGKPTISPQLMLGLINARGQLDDMTITDDGAACTVTMKRKGRSSHSYTFSMADAKAMGLAGKDNWIKQPAIMRQWRAVAGCARVVFPDVIQGLYTAEELGADVIADSEGNMTVISEPPPSPPLIAITRETTPPAPPPPIGAQQPPPSHSAPQTGNAGQERPTLPNGLRASTPSGQPNGGGLPDVHVDENGSVVIRQADGTWFTEDPLFPPEPPGAKVVTLDNGRKVHTRTEPVPGRDVSGFPMIGGGKIHMIELLNKALAEKLVREKNHFSSQIDKCIEEGLISDPATVTADQVLEAMRAHVASKDLQREGVGAR